MALGIILIILGFIFVLEGVPSFCLNDVEYYPTERRDAIILMIIGTVLVIGGGIFLTYFA